MAQFLSDDKLAILDPNGLAQKQFTRLRKTAQKCYEQYIKSVFVSFWAPYVLLRSNFDSKC